jgi:hypothetical protein
MASLQSLISKAKCQRQLTIPAPKCTVLLAQPPQSSNCVTDIVDAANVHRVSSGGCEKTTLSQAEDHVVEVFIVALRILVVWFSKKRRREAFEVCLRRARERCDDGGRSEPHLEIMYRN